MKRVFGMVEAIFDGLYLLAAVIIGCILAVTADGSVLRMLGAAMALILAFGDSFHLMPRIAAILTHDPNSYQRSMGRGKQITSITMTVFYLLLWTVGCLLLQPNHVVLYSILVALLAAVRIGLCLAPQNAWTKPDAPVRWGVYRNIPFFLQGLAVALLFALYQSQAGSLQLMWLAVLLSFGFYLPVVLYANSHPKIGMLMLPKTCAYVWMLVMCLSL